MIAAVPYYEPIKELYRAVNSSNAFDAAVVAKADGKARHREKREQPTRHSVAVRLGWGPGGRAR